MDLESDRKSKDDRPSPDHLAFSHALTTFAVSTGMVGVCLTAIGVVQLVEHSAGLRTLVDELLVIDALLFLTAAICSFVSARLRLHGPWRKFQWAGDLVLVTGMAVMVFNCGLLVAQM